MADGTRPILFASAAMLSPLRPRLAIRFIAASMICSCLTSVFNFCLFIGLIFVNIYSHYHSTIYAVKKNLWLIRISLIEVSWTTGGHSSLRKRQGYMLG